jgi:uncharacterized protein (TIGR03437 family)
MAVDPAELPVQLTASDVPEGASFDGVRGRFEWTPTASHAGKYAVTFKAVNAAGQTSSAQVAIDVTSGDPTLSQAERMCSPGAVASLSGSWLAEPGSSLSDPSGEAADLGGTKVRVNGQYVPLLLASATRVQFLCPAMEPETPLEVVVETAKGNTEPLKLKMQSASPWVFVVDASGQMQDAVASIGMPEMAAAWNAEAAHPGDEVLIWASGLGLSTEPWARNVSVNVGGVDAGVEAVRAVPGQAGVYTVQVRLPYQRVSGNEVPVQLQVIDRDGKRFSSNSINIAVEPVTQ